jgi:hypothetical protein
LWVLFLRYRKQIKFLRLKIINVKYPLFIKEYMSEIEDWLEELMFFSDISACIIAISRKCPRLLN